MLDFSSPFLNVMRLENNRRKNPSRWRVAACCGWVSVFLLGCGVGGIQTKKQQFTNSTTAVGTLHSTLTPPIPAISAITVIAVESSPQFATAPATLALTATTNVPPSTAPPQITAKRGTARLAWNKSQDPSVASYRIFYGTNSRAYYAAASVGNVTNANLTGLEEGLLYYAAVTSVNNLGVNGEFSNEVSFVTSFYISMRQHIWSVEAYGAFGRTNQIKTSTNLSEWRTILEWIGNSNLTNVLHTNMAQAWFRVEAK